MDRIVWDNAAVLCKLFSKRELSRMCIARGLAATGQRKLDLAQRIVDAPAWVDEVMEERLRMGF